MAPKIYDVLIIGGGPAGLSAALPLGRQAMSALILDSQEYRNAPTKHMHMVPGFDHQDPAEFRARVRADLAKRYECIEYKVGTIKEVKKIEDGFEAVGDDGSVYTGRKLCLGTGMRDKLELEVPGYAEAWGKGIYHCLFCHGFEERGAESVGVLATGAVTAPQLITHVYQMAKNLAKSVTIYTSANPDLADLQSSIKSTKVTVDTRPVKSLSLIDGGPKMQLTFEDGSTATEAFIAAHPQIEQRAPFAEQLGLEMGAQGEIVVTAPWNETSVKGCYAAGDAATLLRNAVMAISTGSFAGASAAMTLEAEREALDIL